MSVYDQLANKMGDDYKEILDEEMSKDKMDIIEDAYELAHYNEIVNMLCYEESASMVDLATLKKIISFKGNALKSIYTYWIRKVDSEYINFFLPYDLKEIIEGTFR